MQPEIKSEVGKVTKTKLITIDGEKYVPLKDMPQDIQELYSHFENLKPGVTNVTSTSMGAVPRRNIETSISLNGVPIDIKKLAERFFWTLVLAGVLAYLYYTSM